MTATINASTSSGVVITPDNSGAIALQNAGTTGLNITASGQVTMPLQPRMYASGSGGGVGSSANPLILTANLLNIGSCFSTSTGRFTAPIAGTYQAIFTGLKQGSGGADYVIRKNGTAMISAYATGDVATFSTHIVLALVANDYITFSASGSWYTDYTSYSVQLVG